MRTFKLVYTIGETEREIFGETAAEVEAAFGKTPGADQATSVEIWQMIKSGKPRVSLVWDRDTVAAPPLPPAARVPPATEPLVGWRPDPPRETDGIPGVHSPPVVTLR